MPGLLRKRTRPHESEPRHRFGRSHPYFAYDRRSQSGRSYDVGANADPNPRWLSSLQARGLDLQAGHSDSLRNGDPDVDNRRAVAKWNVANRSTGGNRPTHVSSRDSPQSLEFWEDGRLLFPLPEFCFGNHRSLSANRVVYGWAVNRPEPKSGKRKLAKSTVGFTRARRYWTIPL